MSREGRRVSQDKFCNEHRAVTEHLNRLDADVNTLWTAIDEIRKRLDRLPVWATFLIAALTGMIGWLLKFV